MLFRSVSQSRYDPVEPAGVTGFVDEGLELGWEGDGQDGVSCDVHGGKSLKAKKPL